MRLYIHYVGLIRALQKSFYDEDDDYYDKVSHAIHTCCHNFAFCRYHHRAKSKCITVISISAKLERKK